MLPFVGTAHIGYLPGERILGLSKFARMVEFHARRPQTQERLTQAVAAAPAGAARPARSGRGRGGRPHLHEPARRPRARCAYGHVHAARAAARRPPRAAPSSSRSPGAGHEHRGGRRRAGRRERGRGAARAGLRGRPTLVAAEPHLPYERPPLSKGLLLGTAEPDSVFAHDAEWYADAPGRGADSAAGPSRSTWSAAGSRWRIASWPTTGCCSPPARPRAGFRWPTRPEYRSPTSAPSRTRSRSRSG